MRRRVAKVKDFDDCGQKTFYASREEAYREAAKQIRESLGNVIKKPYKCKFCKGFHLTSIN